MKSNKSMKAEEILTENQLFGLGENMKGIKKHEIIKAMKEYARLQIEKDRERVKANVVMKHHCGTTKNDKPIDYYQNGVDNIQVDLDSIDQTPIQLD